MSHINTALQAAFDVANKMLTVTQLTSLQSQPVAEPVFVERFRRR